jgi:hypothetical protein
VPHAGIREFNARLGPENRGRKPQYRKSSATARGRTSFKVALVLLKPNRTRRNRCAPCAHRRLDAPPARAAWSVQRLPTMSRISSRRRWSSGDRCVRCGATGSPLAAAPSHAALTGSLCFRFEKSVPQETETAFRSKAVRMRFQCAMRLVDAVTVPSQVSRMMKLSARLVRLWCRA